ncbi:MAG: serine/threonine-protein kinase [Myxococcales bacterium]
MSTEHLKLVTKPEKPVDPLIGQVLDGRYQIEKVLGEGGMGLVYKARHTTLGKPLAIKVLKAEVSKDQEIVQRFRQEAQSATAIGNHHIIDISDFGVLSDGSTYFVMEFLDGISLTNAIEPGKPLETRRTVHIAKQLCRALGAAHDIGIVHRDLKPDNIYLIRRGGDNDFVKVLDFGIAKVGGAKSKLTQVGQVFGTPHYMSPEQCAGTQVDKRTDIYALGVIMYEMTSSRVPFDADNLMGILTKHLYEEPVRPHELPPPVDVPVAIEAIIMKCLAKKADVRYQSMQEVLADLELAEQGLTPTAVVDSVRRASATGSAFASPRSGTNPAITMDVGDVQLPQKSNKGLIIGAAAAAVVLIGGIVAAMSGGDEKPEVKPEPPPPVAAQQKPDPIPPPVEEKPAATPPPLPPVEEIVQVTIASTPSGADVFNDGALIGHTPFQLPRPKRGEAALDLSIKLDGYKDLPLRVNAFTTPQLTVELEKERRRSGGGGGSAKPSEAPKPAAEEEKKPNKPKPNTPATEVLDPWS